MKTSSPLLFGFVIVILGIAIEVVEQQDKRAAWIMVIILLLGMVTFNSASFNQQLIQIMRLLNQPSKKAQSVGTQPAATPRKRI